MAKSKTKKTALAVPEATQDATVLAELRALIAGVQTRAAVAVNQEWVLLYWDLGHRIRIEILREERADYGEQILQTLSAQLTEEFGTGYSRPNLVNMMKFAELFPDRSTCRGAISS